MTHIVNGHGQSGEHALLRAMFSDRKHVFVDLLGWDVPVLDGRFEIDQFDVPSTIYLIIAGPGGEHHGSMRLLPTEGPHVLGGIFPFLCDAEPPASPDIWEISRFCLSRSLRATDRRIVRDKLVTAAAVFALQNRITGFSCVADMTWISQILAFGWKCTPLGQPTPLDCGVVGAMHIAISEETPSLMEAAGIWNPTEMLHSQPLAS